MYIIRLAALLLFPLHVRPAKTFFSIKYNIKLKITVKNISCLKINKLTSGQQGKLVYAVQKCTLNVWQSVSVFGLFSHVLNLSLSNFNIVSHLGSFTFVLRQNSPISFNFSALFGILVQLSDMIKKSIKNFFFSLKIRIQRAKITLETNFIIFKIFIFKIGHVIFLFLT